jgi:hypothetical protein
MAWAVALGLVSLVLAGAAVVAAYELADRPQNQAGIVFTDLVPAHGAAPSEKDLGSPSALTKASPVMGTATLEQVRSEGKSDAVGGSDSVRWVRGRVEVYRLSMSQPLIDGIMEVTSDIGTLPSGSTVIKGSWVLRTGQGTWKGSSWTGIVTAEGADHFYVGKAAGTGGFEGLVLILEWYVAKAPGSSPAVEGLPEPIAVSGWIQSTK